MSRRPVAISKTHISRIIDAARKAGARSVEVEVPGAAIVRIMLDGEGSAGSEKPKVVKRPRSLLG